MEVYKLERGKIIFEEKEIPKILVYLVKGNICQFKKKANELVELSAEHRTSLSEIDKKKSQNEEFSSSDSSVPEEKEFVSPEKKRPSLFIGKKDFGKRGSQPVKTLVNQILGTAKKPVNKPTGIEILLQSFAKKKDSSIDISKKKKNNSKLSKFFIKRASCSLAKIRKSKIMKRTSRTNLTPTSLSSSKILKGNFKNPKNSVNPIQFRSINTNILDRDYDRWRTFKGGRGVSDQNFYLGIANSDKLVVNSKEAIVVILRGFDFEEMFQEAKFIFKSKIRQVWSKFKIFEFWEKRNRLDKLMDLAMPFCLDQGNFLFKEGDEVESFFILLEGELGVNKKKKVKNLEKEYEEKFRDDSKKYDKNFQRKKLKSMVVNFERILKAPNIICELDFKDFNSEEKIFYNYNCKVKSKKAFFMKISKEILRQNSITNFRNFRIGLNEMHTKLRREEKIRVRAKVKNKLKKRPLEFKLEPDFVKNMHRKRNIKKKKQFVKNEYMASYNQNSERIRFLKGQIKAKSHRVGSKRLHKDFYKFKKKMKNYKKNLKLRIKDLEAKNKHQIEIQSMNRNEVTKIIKKKEKERLMNVFNKTKKGVLSATIKNKSKESLKGSSPQSKIHSLTNLNGIQTTINQMKNLDSKIIAGRRVSKLDLMFDKIELKSQIAYSKMTGGKSNNDNTFDVNKFAQGLFTKHQKKLRFLINLEKIGDSKKKSDALTPNSGKWSNDSPRSTSTLKNVIDNFKLKVSRTTKNCESLERNFGRRGSTMLKPSSSFSNFTNLLESDRKKKVVNLPSIQAVKEENSNLEITGKNEISAKKKKFKYLEKKKLIAHLEEGNCLFRFKKRSSLKTRTHENLYYNEMMISILKFINYVKCMKEENDHKETQVLNESFPAEDSEMEKPPKEQLLSPYTARKKYKLRKAKSSIISITQNELSQNVVEEKIPFFLPKNLNSSLNKPRKKKNKPYLSQLSTRPTQRITKNGLEKKFKGVRELNSYLTKNSVQNERIETGPLHRNPKRFFGEMFKGKKMKTDGNYKNSKTSENFYWKRGKKKKNRNFDFMNVRCMSSNDVRKLDKTNNFKGFK